MNTLTNVENHVDQIRGSFTQEKTLLDEITVFYFYTIGLEI